MALEIERKFLVTADAWRPQVERCIEMRQGYLSGGEGLASVSVRIEGERANLNVKAAVVGSARAEYEYGIALSEAREMLATLCVGRVEKIRHYVPIAGAAEVWEVDEFLGDNAGLVVAEIELPTPDHAFVRPPWLGRELTDERRWYNHALALRPYAQWSAEERA